MQQRKCRCRRWLNIAGAKRGRIGETVIFTEVGFFYSPFSLVFRAGLHGGRRVWNVFSDRKYWPPLDFFLSRSAFVQSS